MNKVKYNIHDVHYAPITVGADGEFTYGNPVKLPGAVSISLEPSDGDNEIFYADGEEYYVQSSANGYEGDLEMAMITDEFRKAVYGEIEDEDHNLWEGVNDEPKKIALGFVIDGSEASTFFWFLNCSATKPSVEAETNEENKTIGTDTVTIKCSPDKASHIRVKSTPQSDTSDWFGAVKNVPA